MASAAGNMMAPPAPWTTRKVTIQASARLALGSEPAHGGGHGEDDDADHDHLLVPDGVGQTAAEGEERGQREQIGVDRPLHPGAGETELLLDLGYGDGDDGLIDEGHRDGEDHRRQDQILRPASGLTPVLAMVPSSWTRGRCRSCPGGQINVVGSDARARTSGHAWTSPHRGPTVWPWHQNDSVGRHALVTGGSIGHRTGHGHPPGRRGRSTSWPSTSTPNCCPSCPARPGDLMGSRVHPGRRRRLGGRRRAAGGRSGRTGSGALDVVVNVAGVLSFTHTHEQTLDEWNRLIAINLTGTFLVCRRALPHLLTSGGNIVNLASTAAHKGQPWAAAYAASKGGVLAFTRALAVEYAGGRAAGQQHQPRSHRHPDHRRRSTFPRGPTSSSSTG